MTLDGNSGVLSWTPSSGDVAITWSRELPPTFWGTNSQTFTLRCGSLPSGWSPIGRWTKRAGRDSRLLDLNDAECVATNCRCPGREGQWGQVFDGVTTKISAPAHPSLDFANTNSFSLEAWSRRISRPK